MLDAKNFSEPDETTEFPNGDFKVIKVGGKTVIQYRFEPGFHWSRDMGPVRGTERCQLKHLHYIVSGRIRLHLADGSEKEVAAGDVVVIQPDHDSWTVGDEPVVFIDFEQPN